jgi:hypothetical protein
MTKFIRRRSALKMIGTTLSAPFVLGLSGCGTLLYPERQGQEGGRIDATVALLDGFGLLFYVIPGLIALFVDFGSGAIYLPKGQKKGSLIRVEPKPLDPKKIPSIIYEETGIEVDLNDPRWIVKKLNNLDEMEAQFALYDTGINSSTLGS